MRLDARASGNANGMQEIARNRFLFSSLFPSLSLLQSFATGKNLGGEERSSFARRENGESEQLHDRMPSSFEGYARTFIETGLDSRDRNAREGMPNNETGRHSR